MFLYGHAGKLGRIEVILVDDGSRDASFEIMKDYAARDARIKAIHKENGGVSSARNRGLESAEGTYVQFADVDDWLPMDSTKLLVREMEENPVEMVIGDFYRVVGENVSSKGSIEKGGILTRQDYADEMMRSPADMYFGVLWNKLYRRDILERESIRMDENISFSEDMIFNLEYLLHADSIAVLKAPVYYYHYTKGSLVERNMSLSSTIRMKKSVIGYYNRFYKSTFDTQDYEERLPVIYGYLLSFSKDFISLPFVSGTKRLGTETGAQSFYSQNLDRSPLQTVYLSSRLMDRLIDTVAKKHRLEHNETAILYFLNKLEDPCSVEEISAFTGMSRMSVIISLAKLIAGGLVIHESESDGSQKGTYRYNAPGLTADLEQIERDFDFICYAGLNDEELALHRQTQQKITANIRRHMALTEM